MESKRQANHAAQTAEQQQLSLQCRHDQLTTKSAEEREARLQQMSALQRERLATESTEERKARLQWRRDQLTTERERGWATPGYRVI